MRQQPLGAMTHAFSGNATTAIELAERALQLSPFDHLARQAHFALTLAAIAEGRFSDAAASASNTLVTNSNLSSLYFIAAVAHVLARDETSARGFAEEGLNGRAAFACASLPR